MTQLNANPFRIMAGVIVIFLSQIAAWIWNRQFMADFLLLNYGSATLLPAFFETLAGILSGFVLVLILPINRRPSGSAKSISPLRFVLLAIVPLLALLVKFFLAAGGAYSIHPPLRFLHVWEWAIYSQVPALWLGLVLGIFLLRLTTIQQEGIEND
jgi:hypothetical protein